VPRAPSTLSWLPSAREDLESIHGHNSDHAQRCLDKISEWETWIELGTRVPQERLTYLTGVDDYNFYREWVGRDGYRIVFEIAGDVMTVVGIRPKDDDTYDLEEFVRRMDRDRD